MKYSDLMCSWLSELGYKKCFFLAGGNIMHLLESATNFFECIPFVHEVGAGIAAEYHNEIASEQEKAFVLVTAGPGVTNVVTALAGSFLESRDLLVLAGQVKSSDLKLHGMRQNGIQEVDGESLVRPLAKHSLRLSSPINREQFSDLVLDGLSARKGPVFIEVCLDVQASECTDQTSIMSGRKSFVMEGQKIDWSDYLKPSRRPILLLGGEISRDTAREMSTDLASIPLPIMTSWNAADRVSAEQRNYFGRPNTWGMRYSNILLQQADLILALGTRLGLQQTGFNSEGFSPNARILHVFSDRSEFLRVLNNKKTSLEGSGELALIDLLGYLKSNTYEFQEWIDFCDTVKNLLPLSEDCNKREDFEGYTNPYDFYIDLSRFLRSGDSVIPASSGGSETVAMQSLNQPPRVNIVTSSSLASMGYGLAGAIGAALSTKERVFLIEGDGGFLQNLQELGTIMAQNLDVKMFIFCNDGYASIRMTQKNYFGGHYIGCDSDTGLGIPKWSDLFRAYKIPCWDFSQFDKPTLDRLEERGPAAFLVRVHPEQTYYPKIASQIVDGGKLVSSALHNMYPPLDSTTESQVIRHL